MKEPKKSGEKPSRVALLRCDSYDLQRVTEAVKQATDELGGIDRFVKRGHRVLLKPNLLVGRPADALVNTHPGVVRAIIRLVKKAGGKPFIGDSPAIGSATRAASKCGVTEVGREENVEIINFNRPVDVDNPSGTKFKRFKIDQSVLDADVIINLPKLKTHGQMTLTLGVKNIFGVIPGTRKSQWHLAAGTDRLHFARMLVDLYRKVSPQLTLMDGVVGMHGNGPQNGDPKRVALVAASEDAVALDAAVCEIVGLKRERMPTTLAAQEMGVGQTRLERISIAGEPLENCRVEDFAFPETGDLIGLFPGFLKDHVRDWLTTRPLLDPKKCEMCLICMDKCPADAIKVHNNSLQFNLKQCIRCFCCQEMCPEGAISVGSGTLAKVLRL
ncbi:MAG: DUF362 domain-containing protein [Candidatus Hydrogenedentota bacterium]|nr:MAG: DUF362 domain-containing protein [Candidatus Hydrogenedentota bacterium]